MKKSGWFLLGAALAASVAAALWARETAAKEIYAENNDPSSFSFEEPADEA